MDATQVPWSKHYRMYSYVTRELPALIAEEAREGDLVICLGAGDITGWAYALPAQLEALAAP